MINKTQRAFKKQIYKKVLALFPELKEKRSTMNVDLDWMKDKEDQEKMIFIKVSVVNSEKISIEICERDLYYDELGFYKEIKFNVSFSKKMISIDFLKNIEYFTYKKINNTIEVVQETIWARDPDESISVLSLLDVYKESEIMIDYLISMKNGSHGSHGNSCYTQTDLNRYIIMTNNLV